MTLTTISTFIPCMIGTTELILIGALVLLLFGGKKLPELMRGIGQGVRSFKQGMAGDDTPAAKTPSVDPEVKLPDQTDTPSADTKQ